MGPSLEINVQEEQKKPKTLTKLVEFKEQWQPLVCNQLASSCMCTIRLTASVYPNAGTCTTGVPFCGGHENHMLSLCWLKVMNT